MPVRKNNPSLFAMVVGPVALLCIASFALSGFAVQENLRFMRVTDQLLSLVESVRQIAGQQKGFAQSPGEDIWADLEHVGQIVAPEARKNPWLGDVRAVTIPTDAIRIETDLPNRDCRRVTSYFLARKPADLGLLAIQTQDIAADPTGNWAQIYPAAAIHRTEAVIEIACGRSSQSRVALIFRIR